MGTVVFNKKSTYLNSDNIAITPVHTPVFTLVHTPVHTPVRTSDPLMSTIQLIGIVPVPTVPPPASFTEEKIRKKRNQEKNPGENM